MDANIIFESKNIVEEKKPKNKVSLFFHAKLEINSQCSLAYGYVRKVIILLKTDFSPFVVTTKR